MSNVQIPNMTPAISLNGSEQMEAVQAGSTVRVTVDQIATYTDGAHGLTFIAPLSETGDVVTLSTVPVDHGGTGAVTLALNNVLLGNGTSAVQVVAPGISGNVLTSDGTTWSSAAPVPDGVSTFSADTTGLTPATPTSGAVVLGGTLVVDNGGTGAATLALNNVLLGNGTDPVQEIAPGSSGNVLTSDGTTWASTAPVPDGVSTFSADTTGLTPATPTSGAVVLGGTLVVANGGTGAATLALNNVVLGNGTSAVQLVAPSSSGNVLTSDGTTWASTALSSGAVTTFTAGTTGLTPSSPTAGAVSLSGTLIGANGGTGVANTGKTITLGGNLTTSGAYDSTLTATAATSVTLPTTGTLATLAGSESLTNKKLGSLTTNGPIYTSGSDGTLNSETSLGVARGGTGAATLALNNVVLGNGTSAVQVVAPGGSGNVLTSNGTTWASTAPSGSGVVDWAGGTTGLTPATATSGSVTLAGTLVVANGGTGAATFTDGGVLIGKGTAAFETTGVLADGTIIIGDGATNPVTLAAFSSSTGTLKVANGGTGAATLALNNVVLGNGTSAVQLVAPSSSGNVLTSDGTTWASTALSSGAVTTFTAGTTGLTPSSPTAGAVSLAGTLVVANGGTGAATLALNNVVLGNGTSAVQLVAPSSSGNVLTSDGTTWASTALSSGAVTTFTAGTTGLTPSSPTAGAVTLAGTLAVANGGTGQSSVLTQYGVIYGSSSTVQGVTAAGTTGQILVATTSAAPSWGTQSGGVTWSAISTNTNAAAGSGYMVSTGAGVVTLTLPASPSVGDYLSVCDAAGTFATNNLTVARNTQLIQGSATDLTCAINGQSFGLVYQGATNGWRITQS